MIAFKEDENIIEDQKKTEVNIRVKNWYAIYTRSRFEKRVYDSLVEEGIEAFLPLQTVIRKWSDRKKKVKVPFIKSYVFVRVEEKNIYNKVLSVFGTVMVLKHLGKPAIVRDYEINNLRILTENEANVTLVSSKINIEIGAEVEIDKGALMGLKGRCVRVNGKRSIMLEFETLGTMQLVEVAAKYLKC